MKDITNKERAHRRALISQARSLIHQMFPVEDADEQSLMLGYNGFYLQIVFSELHPLIVFSLARTLNRHYNANDIRLINNLNNKSVLGSHAINIEADCYSYHSVYWLDTELTKTRFREVFARIFDEAVVVYNKLTRQEEGTV